MHIYIYIYMYIYIYIYTYIYIYNTVLRQALPLLRGRGGGRGGRRGLLGQRLQVGGAEPLDRGKVAEVHREDDLVLEAAVETHLRVAVAVDL